MRRENPGTCVLLVSFNGDTGYKSEEGDILTALCRRIAYAALSDKYTFGEMKNFVVDQEMIIQWLTKTVHLVH